MARTSKAQRALDRAHEHREALERLIANADDLRDWFRDWAESQLRRDRFYIYSDAEHAVLANELDRMKPHTGFAGYSVGDLINAAMAFSSDCDLPDEEFGFASNAQASFRVGSCCVWSASAGTLPASPCRSRMIWKQRRL